MDGDRIRAAAARSKNPKVRARLLFQADMGSLVDTIVTCRKCPLHSGRHKTVPAAGKWDAKMVLVGEAPGRNEDETGIPFVGRAGRLLDRALAQAGIDRDDVAILNTVACRPPSNRRPDYDEIHACYMGEQIDLFHQAWVGVALGVTALQTIADGAYVRRGVPFWKDRHVWVGTYHPAFALRQPSALNQIIEDIQTAMLIRTGRSVIPKPKPVDIIVDRDVADTITDQGWALLWSDVLQDKVVYKTDDDVNVPDAIANLPAYTLTELASLAVSGATREDIRRMHMVKVEFGGTVVT